MVESTLCIGDLGGCERLKKSCVTGDRQVRAAGFPPLCVTLLMILTSFTSLTSLTSPPLPLTYLVITWNHPRPPAPRLTHASHTQVEATNINVGLLALKRCIAALNQRRVHVPYGDNQLTSLLRGSLGGGKRRGGRALMIIAARPEAEHSAEMLNALR